MVEYVGGVVSNYTPDGLMDDIYDGDSLDFLAHDANCPNEYHDTCWESQPSDTILIGFHKVDHISDAWFCLQDNHDFMWGVDPDAEYSAIVGEQYTQIVHSNYVQPCQKCSPCYPLQGDLDTPGSFYTAYTLPPDIWGDNQPDGIQEVSR